MEQVQSDTQSAREGIPATKFCKHCGAKIPTEAILCTACGRQVEELHTGNPQPNIVITNTNTNVVGGRPFLREKNKWTALLLCFFLGWLGAHKFYEGKVGMGVLYLFTMGLFGIGILVDFIVLLFKPNPYYI